ncbi:TVP38/TMEM64 family protein [Methanocella sp. MCL-LM]|uniref:TVP38/TMEM64 family protein n=1 Tax=Methanocella sp. MCL-LM TaxID=3412035 RepID=UPI003C788BFF
MKIVDVRHLLNVKVAAVALWAIFIIAVIAIIGPGNLAAGYEKLSPDGIKVFVLSFGALAILAFLAISLIRPFFFLPLTPFTIASGFLFGIGWGLTWAMIGSTLSALLVFGISRYLFQDYVKRKILIKYPAIDSRIQENGWRYVLFLRLIPVIPYDVAGYLAGASRVRLRDYLIGTIGGELPGAIILVIFGSSLAEPGSLIFYLSLILALSLIVLPELARRLLRKSA